MSKKLSVVIPSWKDPNLQRTIDSILENSILGDDLEIVVTLDGYWTETPLEGKNLIVVHKGKNGGMREAINTAVDVATGEFIMRTDEHCIFAKGFDKELTDTCQDNWIMTAVRYFLDVDKWEIMDEKPVVYEKLKSQNLGDGLFKWQGTRWSSREKERKDIMIDETMAMQGSMWIMKKAWWEKVIKKLDTRYGQMYQDSHEMVFKTWKAGGKLMVNKNTWFAHKHVSFPRTHNHGRKDYAEGMKFSYDTWKDYYEKEVKPKWNV